MDYAVCVDSGVEGALVLVCCGSGSVLDRYVMPIKKISNENTKKSKKKSFIDTKALINILDEWKFKYGNLNVILEEPFAPRVGFTHLVYSQGILYGMLLAILQTKSNNIQRIAPRKWQSAIFKKFSNIYDSDLGTKQNAFLIASSLYPDFDFRKNKRCTNPHDGIVDATLIGYYWNNLK